MWVEAILSKGNVISLMGDFLPLSIHLGENSDDGHYLELFEPRQVALVEEQGLPLDAVALAVAWGQVRVTSEAMVIVVSFHSRVLRGDGELSERAGSRDELALTELAPPTGAKRANLATLGARPNGMARFVALAGGAAFATLAAWAVVGIGASAWRYAAGRR
jgi:hypothetical protein